MAATINVDAYSNALVVLATAGIVVPLVQRIGLNPILGYLAAGAILGPFGLGGFAGSMPGLSWVTIADARSISSIADLGVVFLLFLIGLELSFERLKAMRRLVIGLGGLQVLISTIVLTTFIAWLGLAPPVALILGACLALSSTAIVLDVLSRQGRLATSNGRATFSVLLAQDIAVIPILVFISVLGSSSGGSVAQAIGASAAKVFTATALIFVVGRIMLRPLFRLVARTGSSELFIAAILFVIVATGVVAALADLSMALGAFVAGLLLAETEYRKAIEATIEPFKGLLLGIFFFTVGMSIDFREIASNPLMLFSAAVALIVVKALIAAGLARLFKLSVPAAVETGLLLGAGGEFAFVGVGLAAAYGIIAPAHAAFVLTLTALTMASIPLVSLVGRRAARLLTPPRPPDAALLAQPEARARHAIVVGYGRVGKVVCGLLKEHGVGFTAVDGDPVVVGRERQQNPEVYFGNATDAAFLRACGLADAAGVILTLHTQSLIEEVVATVRRERPDIMIVARARDADHARRLYRLGVTDAVPETIEASLQLSEAALVGLGVPTGPVIASIHEQRDIFRQTLQTAALEANVPGRHSLRRATR